MENLPKRPPALAKRKKTINKTIKTAIKTPAAAPPAVKRAKNPRPETPRQLKASKRRPVVPNAFRLGYLLHDVSRMRRTLFDQYLKPEGLTRAQLLVMAALSRGQGAGTTCSELAKLLSVGKVTVGGLIKRLEATGYVYRRAGRADRRSKLIFVSAKGTEAIGRMRDIVEPLNRQVLREITPADLETMERLLISMRRAVTEMLDDNFVSDDEPLD